MADYAADNKIDDSPFPGKIAVVTNHPSINEDDFHSADRLLAKYGDEKIIHATVPEDFIAEQNKMIYTIVSLAADSDVKALIINQAVEGSNAAVDKLRKIRNDLFIIYCNTNEKFSEAIPRADLILSLNEVGMGSVMVKQAKKQGAKVFVHYSFPRHMSKLALFSCREKIKEECLREGLLFVEAAAPDPTGVAGISGAQQFILADVPKLVAKYGEDTAFFSTCCGHQIPLIKAVVDSHAIYPQPCCPSPFHGFPEALGIKTSGGSSDLNHVIGEACRIAAEKNMTDRLSTWPVSASMMFTNAGAEYAIKRINHEVPETGIDSTVLEACMDAFIEEVVGEASIIYMSSFSEGSIIHDNYKLIYMSYLDF